MTRRYVLSEQYKQEDGNYKCPYCNILSSKHGIMNHVAHHELTKSELSKRYASRKGRVAWNKGLTKETDNRVKTNSLSISKTMTAKVKSGCFIPCKHSKEFLNKLSLRQSLHNSGGKCKWYTVSGQKVQGTWERDLALKFEYFQIQWNKLKCNRDVWFYQMKGKTRAYTPDFYLPTLNIYLDPKAYYWGNDKNKIQTILDNYPDRQLIIINKQLYNQLITSDNRKKFIQLICRCSSNSRAGV